MFNSNAHPQVVYSLNALSEALFRLLAAQPLEEITVTALCAEAAITRKTYYRNCESKLDLVDYRIGKSLQALLDTVAWELTDPAVLYRNFFRYWLGQRDFLTTLQQRGLFPRFYQQFTRYFNGAASYPFLQEFLQGRPNPSRLQLYHVAFLVGGLCNVLDCWVQEDFATPVEELVLTMAALAPDVGRREAGTFL